MNTQEIFNAIVTHLIRQGARATPPTLPPSPQRDTPSCMYHAADGKRCAVGCLIDDEHYSGELEGWGVDGSEPGSSCVRQAIAASIGRELQADEVELLGRLQGIHDGHNPCEWLLELRELARESGLALPPELALPEQCATTQGLLDTVVAHLRTQKAQCRRDVGAVMGTCAYRNSAGQKCAVGALIADAVYTPALDITVMGVSSYEVRAAVVASIGRNLTFPEVSLLRSLQGCHDTFEPYDWEEELEKRVNGWNHCWAAEAEASGETFTPLMFAKLEVAQ